MNRPSTERTKYFMLEADRNTQPIVRKDLVQSSVLRKLMGYAATHDAGVPRKRYGLGNWRVLLVTHGRPRIKTVIDAHQKHTRSLLSPRLVLMADRDALLSSELFDYPWTDLIGETHRLLD